MDDGLNNGMVCGVHVGVEGKWTFTLAVKCIKTDRCNDKIVFFAINFIKTDIERMPFTVGSTRFPRGEVSCCTKNKTKQTNKR